MEQMQNKMLYHHGILGMKWGKRNGPPYPLDYGDHSSSEKKAGWRKSIRSSGSLKISTKKKKHRPSVEINNKKSNHQRELELKFRQQGMSYHQAQKAAEGRIRAEKIVIGTVGAIAIASLAAYGAYKYHDYVNDKILSENIVFQRMASSSDTSNMLNSRNFYASFTESDKRLYGMYGKNLAKRASDGDGVDILRITREGGIKVASEKTSRDEFFKLWKNDDNFKESLRKGLSAGKEFADKNHPLNKKQLKAYETVLSGKELTDKEIKTKAYDAFNINVVFDHGKDSEDVMNKFSNELKKKGIGAINDINDIKYSRYKSNRPIIVFKDDSAKYNINRKTMDEIEITKRAIKGAGQWSLNTVARSSPSTVAVALSGVGAVSVAEYSFVMLYKKDHPNTKLTNSQILKKYQDKAA